MRRIALVFFVLSMTISALMAMPPRFTGEVWAGSEVSPRMGPVNVYWVFEGDTFHEFIYYFRSDEIRLLASGQYLASKTPDGTETYRLQMVPRAPDRPAVGEPLNPIPVHAQACAIRVELTIDNRALTFPAGDRLFRLERFAEYVPPIEHGIGTVSLLRLSQPKPQIWYEGCCGDCFAVHNFLGISFLNGICCGGGCSGGGGGRFGGGGASGNWN